MLNFFIIREFSHSDGVHVFKVSQQKDGSGIAFNLNGYQASTLEENEINALLSDGKFSRKKWGQNKEYIIIRTITEEEFNDYAKIISIK